MKIGKRKLAAILAREIGRSKEDILNYGKYTNFGSQEILEVGAYKITNMGGKVKVTKPVGGSFEDDEIRYETYTVNKEAVCGKKICVPKM